MSSSLLFFLSSIFSRVSVVIQSVRVRFVGPITCWHEDVTASLITFHFSSTVSSALDPKLLHKIWNLLLYVILNLLALMPCFISRVCSAAHVLLVRWLHRCSLKLRFMWKTNRWWADPSSAPHMTSWSDFGTCLIRTHGQSDFCFKIRRSLSCFVNSLVWNKKIP